MKLCWCVLAVMLGAGASCLAATTPAKEATAATAAAPRVEDTVTFFLQYIANSVTLPRAAFASDEEWKRSLPTPLDPQAVIYFRVGDVNRYAKRTRYDAKTASLICTAGLPYGLPPDIDGTNADTLMPILQVMRNGDPFLIEQTTAKPAAAAPGTTPPLEVRQLYVLNLFNRARIPATVLDPHTGWFTLAAPVPAAEVEATAAHVELLLGVKLLGYAQSVSGCVYRHPATADDPDAFESDLNLISGNLAWVILRRSDTKAVLAQYDIPEPPATPPPAATPPPSATPAK